MGLLRAGNFWLGVLAGGVLVWILLPTASVPTHSSSLRGAVSRFVHSVPKTAQASSGGFINEKILKSGPRAQASATSSSATGNFQDLFMNLTFQELQLACDQKKEQLIKKSFDTRYKEIGEKWVDSLYEKVLPSLQTSAYWVAEGSIEINNQPTPTTIALQIYNSHDHLGANIFEKLENPADLCWILEAWFKYMDKKLSYGSSNCFSGMLFRKGKPFLSMHTMNLSDFYDKLYFLTVSFPTDSIQVEYLPAGQDRWKTGEGFNWKASTQEEIGAMRGTQFQSEEEN